MSTEVHQTLERLVATCARRAWIVAFGLLRDADEAYDAVQQAFVVALRKSDRIPRRNPWPWFGVVVAHEARNLRRKKRPKTNVELGSPHAELGGSMGQDPTDPARAAHESEERDRLREAIDQLPVAERDAITLTRLAGMTHRAAAEALDMPRQTVTFHVKRGLERVARILDTTPRRASARLGALPVLGWPLNWDSMVASWSATTSSLLPATGATGVVTATALGGIAMTTKMLWIVSVAAALGIGALGGHAVGSAEDDAGPDRVADARTGPESARRAHAAPTLRGDAADEEPSSATVDEIEQLRAKLSSVVQANRDLEARLAAAQGGEAGASTGPLFTFGTAGKLDAIRTANWTEMSQASKSVGEAILEIAAHTERGEQAPQATYLRLQENVERMRKYEYRTIGKIATAAKHNGEFTHPVTIANLLGASLADAGEPLTQAQIASINELGTGFERDLQEMQRRYATAPRVRRMVEEYRLKGQFVERVKRSLTKAQRNAVYNPLSEGLAGLDLLSPTLMLLHTSPVLPGENAAEIATKLEGVLTRKFGIPDEESATLKRIVESWTHDTAALLAKPVTKSRLKNYSYAQGLASGEATVALTERLLKEIRLSDKARSALLDDFAVYVPRRYTPTGS